MQIHSPFWRRKLVSLKTTLKKSRHGYKDMHNKRMPSDKGLEKFFLKGTKSAIQAKHVSKLRLILGRLNASINAQDMNLPGLYLHALRADKGEIWSVRVSGNWRVTFRFVDGGAEIVNYEDYH